VNDTNPKPLHTSGAAFEVARVLKAELEPFCERCEIAGSLRRGRPAVGDIEIVYIPKLIPSQTSLLGEVLEYRNQAAGKLELMLNQGILKMRLNKKGKFTWGELNKLAVHVASGIPVDFFGTTEQNWTNTFFVRTGGKATNIEIAIRAKGMGWRFEAYGKGFTRGPKTIVTMSEEQIFQFVGLPYLPPSRRP
jgi:DNA polymerase (family 10)